MDRSKYFQDHGYTRAEINKCYVQITKKYGHMKYDTFLRLMDVKKIITSLSNINRIPIIRDIYYEGYRFPAWTYQAIENRPELKPLVTVYYDSDDNLSTVRKLCIEREPVDIVSMRKRQRHYSQDRLEHEFGWRIGLYPRIWKKEKKLGPNFAIYCKTPVIASDGTKYPDAHIINSIGAALDINSGPDYKYFIEQPSYDDRLKKLTNFYQQVFHFIFQCADEKRLSTVCMSLVGGGYFAGEYPGGKGPLQDEIWIPAFIATHRQYPDTHVVFMGAHYDFLQRLYKYGGTKYNDIGLWPELLNDIDTKDTLIVNAWDPFSFVGNGNEGDGSLDGRIGRSTACSMLCWPLVNSEMTYSPVDIPFKFS